MFRGTGLKLLGEETVHVSEIDEQYGCAYFSLRDANTLSDLPNL